jgi:hypothetical protein
LANIAKAEVNMPERRTAPRKSFSFYMRVLNDDTQEILGHMVEISKTGFRLETTESLPLEKDYYLRLELTSDLGDVPYIVFIARSKWCKIDEIQPNLYRVGFEIVEALPEDHQVLQRIFDKYAA